MKAGTARLVDELQASDALQRDWRTVVEVGIIVSLNAAIDIRQLLESLHVYGFIKVLVRKCYWESARCEICS